MVPNSMQLSQLMKNGRARHRIKSGKRKARAPCMRKCSISRFTWTSLFLILVPLDWGIQSKIHRGCLPNAHSLTDSPQKNCCSSNVWMHGKTWQTIRRACFALCTHTHTHFHFPKDVNSHDTLNFPHLQVKRGRGRDRNYRKKREKERKEESRNKWKTASPRSVRLLWKRDFALTNFNQVAGSQRCQPHGSEGNAPWPRRSGGSRGEFVRISGGLSNDSSSFWIYKVLRLRTFKIITS